MYREVTMIEVRQVLRLRGEGLPKKWIRRPALRRDELLIAPVLTNRLPWSRGYFQNIEFRPLTPWDRLPVHCFRDPLTGRYFDERGQSLSSPVPPVGDYGLKSFRTIDDLVSDALGISRIPD